MTKRQFELLSFITVFISENGYSPSYREMGEALGWKSLGGIKNVLDGLEAAGKITQRPGHFRTVEVIG